MSEEMITTQADDVMITLLSNVIAINLFIGLKYGEEGADTLAKLEDEARKMLTTSSEDNDEQGSI